MIQGNTSLSIINSKFLHDVKLKYIQKYPFIYYSAYKMGENIVILLP